MIIGGGRTLGVNCRSGSCEFLVFSFELWNRLQRDYSKKSPTGRCARNNIAAGCVLQPAVFFAVLLAGYGVYG